MPKAAPEDEGILDTLAVERCLVVTAAMDDGFKIRVQEGYEKDPQWKRIKDILEDKDAMEDNTARLPFEVKNDLLYYLDPSDVGPRLCVPDHEDLSKEVFQLADDEPGHTSYARTYK